MSKNLEDKFNLYCSSKNFEINQNQILVIKKLQEYYKENFKSFISETPQIIHYLNPKYMFQ